MSRDLKDIKFKHGETPTPMRMMEDPTLWHVLPSRQSQSKKEKDMAPPPSKRKKIVLEEEEYVETLGKVIERDYFPDLDKYRTHLEYLKAIEAKDFDRAERLKYHLLVIQKIETPGATPAVTPAYLPGATPSVENDSYSKAASGEEEDGSWVIHDVDNKEVRIPSNISIGELANMITSEDNDNFQQKQELEAKQRREKYWWIYGGEDPEKRKRLLLYDDEQIKKLEDESVRATWPHRIQNGFMDTPTKEDAYDTCGVKLLTDVKPTQKLLINPKNTRLRTYKEPEMTAMPPPKPITPANELIATPAPEPGVDLMPQMEWGDIGGTPMTLGSAVAPLDMPMTPLPKANKREAVAERLYKSMKRAHNTSRVKTPVVGGNPAMSPAAQRLQQKLKGKVSSMDSMLRKSYTPAKSMTPGGMTPGMTPGMKKRVGFVSTPSSVRSDRKVVIKKSVTDGLM